MRHAPTRLATLALLVLASLPATAQAQGYYERAANELPGNADRTASIVVVAPKAGWVHWGLDGWNLPAPALRSASTIVAAGAAETPLEGPGADGCYRAQLGPFDKAGSPRELDLVLHFADGTWDSNGGRNYTVALVDAGQAPVHRRPISIGRGPWLGQLAGVDQFEDVLDWDATDCRGVTPSGDERRLNDGLDDSRDLVALYSRRENGSLFLRADLLDLALGAESSGGVVLGFLVSWDNAQGGQTWLPDFAHGQTAHPWKLALLVRDENHYEVFDSSWNLLSSDVKPNGWFRGASYRSDLDTVETGLSLDALKAAGWDGRSRLLLQAYTQKEGDGDLTDVFGGSLDVQVAETTRGGTAKLSTILHGNQSIQQPSSVRELITTSNIQTPNGRPTGYHRALDAHILYRLPVNIHVSGTLASTLEWAEPSFNDRIRGMVSGKPWLGRGALVGGVLSEHILPYFESAKAGSGEGPNVAGARLDDRLLAGIYGIAKPRVFWTPERVIRGSTFPDILAAGYAFTVIDQKTHLADWFGVQDAWSTNGHKLNRISGVSCFAINDEEDQKKFANTDGGLWYDTRVSLLGRALSGDQQQLTLVFDDWEAYSGRSFTSFGVGNDNPDNYDLNVRWIASHPWIQVETLDTIASWGWNNVERGNQPNLPVDTYDWLRHATEIGYDHWFYGSNQEQSFTSMHPALWTGHPTPKAFGQLGQAGTIFGDTWSDVAALPSGQTLRDTAAAVYGLMTFETAWHDNSQNDYSRDANGNYLHPDTSFANVSGWALSLHAHVGDASLVAAAGRWAANPPAAGTFQVWHGDVDQDGEDEYVVASESAFCAFKLAGGRLVLAAARDPLSGEADVLTGAQLQGTGDNLQRDYLETQSQDVKRPPCLVDFWATGGAGSYYVNAGYSASALSNGWKFTSPDGKVAKTVTLQGGRLSVHYDLDASVGDLYVRCGLSPLPLAQLLGEARLTDSRPSPSSLVVAARSSAHKGSVTLSTQGGASINDAASFGPDGPRSLALLRQVEVHGMGGHFDLALDLSVTR